MTRGILLISFGQDYDTLAAHTAKYTRKNTELPIHVITNLPEAERSSVWDSIGAVTMQRVQMAQSENRVVKTDMPNYTPFDQTLYLDCDAVVQLDAVDQLFECLGDNDIALYPHARWDGTNPVYKLYLDTMTRLHSCCPITAYHGACSLFTRGEGAKRFFSRWQRYWRTMGSGREMPALMCTAQHAVLDGVRIIELPDHALAPNVEDARCIIQHDFGSNKNTTFCAKFDIPPWRSFRPYDYGRSGQWDLQPLNKNVLRPTAGDGMCIAVYTWGWYNEYAPLFAYFALAAYPAAHVRIYTPESEFAPHVQTGLDIVRANISTRLSLRTNWKTANHFNERKHARWVLPESEFLDFEYVYIGDIDMLMAPEQPDMVSLHLDNVQKFGVPYSNLRRWNAPKKASGLHFIVREPYYAAMGPVIERYMKTPPGREYLDGRTNEQFLCHMLTEAFGKPPPIMADRESFEQLRPHHGFHLGLLRSNAPDSHYYTPYWVKLSDQVSALVANEAFRRLCQCIKHDFAHSRIERWERWLRNRITPDARRTTAHVDKNVSKRAKGRAVNRRRNQVKMADRGTPQPKRVVVHSPARPVPATRKNRVRKFPIMTPTEPHAKVKKARVLGSQTRREEV